MPGDSALTALTATNGYYENDGMLVRNITGNITGNETTLARDINQLPMSKAIAAMYGAGSMYFVVDFVYRIAWVGWISRSINIE